MELAIGELAVVLDQSQPRVSRHVRILVEAGIVERRREGSWVFLRIIRGGAVGDILAHADDWPFSAREALVVAHDARRLAAVRTERVAAAERSFAEHALDWDALRARQLAQTDAEAALLALMNPTRHAPLPPISLRPSRTHERPSRRARQ